MATRDSESSVARYTRIARRVRFGLAAVIGVCFLTLLSSEGATHGLEQAGVTNLLGAAVMIVPIVIMCFFIIDIAGCIVALALREKNDARRWQRLPIGRALAETLVTPALVYLEILGVFWLRSR